MIKYDKLKKKYDYLIKQSLEKNKRILIVSFVEYYDEEFRDIIGKKYNEITFVYYINWKMVDLVVNEFLLLLDNIDKYTDFIEFSNSHEKTFLPKICKSKTQQSKLPENLIGMINTSIVKKRCYCWLVI